MGGIRGLRQHDRLRLLQGLQHHDPLQELQPLHPGDRGPGLMQIIDPTYVTDATLVSSDIPEIVEGYPEWDALTTYMTGKRVAVTAAGIHKLYESLWGTGNLNKYPPDNLTGTPTYWLELSATNRWRLFDMIVAPARAEASVNVTLAQWEAGEAWEADRGGMGGSFMLLEVMILHGLFEAVALINV